MPNDSLGYRWQPGVGDVANGNEATPRSGSPSNVRVLNLRIPKKPIAGAIAPQALLESPGQAGAPPGFLDDLLHIFQPPAQPMAPPLPMQSFGMQFGAQPGAPQVPTPMSSPAGGGMPALPPVDSAAPVPLPIQATQPEPEPSPFMPQPDVPLNLAAPPPPRVVPGDEAIVDEPIFRPGTPRPPTPADVPVSTNPGEHVPGAGFPDDSMPIGVSPDPPPLPIGGDVFTRPGRRAGRGSVGF
jgi:hypothetical protein